MRGRAVITSVSGVAAITLCIAPKSSIAPVKDPKSGSGGKCGKSVEPSSPKTFLSEGSKCRNGAKVTAALPPSPPPAPPLRHLCLCAAPRSRRCRFAMRTTLREPQRDTGREGRRVGGGWWGWRGGVLRFSRVCSLTTRGGVWGEGRGGRDIKSMMRLLVEV